MNTQQTAAAKSSHPLTGRSKEAGMKIKVIDKTANRTREGSNNAEFFAILNQSKTTDEAVEKIRTKNSKPWDIVRMAVARGYITLEPASGTAKKAAPTKAAAKKAPAKPAKDGDKKASAKKRVRTVGRRAADQKKVVAEAPAAVQ